MPSSRRLRSPVPHRNRFGCCSSSRALAPVLPVPCGPKACSSNSRTGDRSQRMPVLRLHHGRVARSTTNQRSFLEPGRVAADPAHGTAIAALLVGAPDPAHPGGGGLLPDADLYAAATFAQRGGGQSEADAFAIAEALDWMVQKHVRVVNVSLAGDDNALMALAVRRASARGTVLIAAAGNAGPHAPPAYPGALPEVIAVTAVDQQGAVFAGANRGSYIAFAAPGVRIWVPTPDGEGGYETGTSFSLPFAQSTAALEMMQGAPADADSLRQRLAAKARTLGASGRNPTYGYGLVQASASCGVVTTAE